MPPILEQTLYQMRLKLHLEVQNEPTSKIHSTSTGMLPGSEPMPTALRADARILTEHFCHQFGKAVDNPWMVAKLRSRIDHAQSL